MKKTLAVFLSCIITLGPQTAYAQNTALHLPAPGSMVNLSQPFQPATLRGMTIHPAAPLKFDFILDPGESGTKGAPLKEEGQRLVNYFLAAMTVPQNDLWVNLSPVENDRIVPKELIKTELGREFLAQDYLLKQLTASLLHPGSDSGKDFWSKVYAQAQEKLGTTDIPVNTFNKVWIIPEKASVYEKDLTVYITDLHLKVMMESDYLAERKEHGAKSEEHRAESNEQKENSNNSSNPSMLSAPGSMLTQQVLKEIIIPVLEREVNEGQNFAPLRQAMYALVLAQWYQDALKESILNQAYTGKNKTAGIDLNDPADREKIYAQYMAAYKKGVFNFIKEEPAGTSGEMIPRRYFSGGVIGAKAERTPVDRIDPAQAARAQIMAVRFDSADAAMSGTAPSDPELDQPQAPAWAQQTLDAVGWKHLLSNWTDSNRQTRAKLLQQIREIDWEFALERQRNEITNGVPTPVIPQEFSVPAHMIADTDAQAARETARQQVLEVHQIVDDPAVEETSAFAVDITAGGSGADFISPDPKGFIDSTPFSRMSLYEGLIKKVQAAASYYGHSKSFPIILMTSDVTHEGTLQFLDQHDWFGMKNRIFVAKQGSLPLFDARTKLPFLKADGTIATGGMGHGDIFDDILQRPEVVAFMDRFGVKVVQHMNMDNQLNPLADERLIGYGEMAHDPDSTDRRAHIALGVIAKTSTSDRLGNQIKGTDGQWYTVGYGAASADMRANVLLGDPSFRAVWRQTLPGALRTPWRIDRKKETNLAGERIDVLKLERASDETPRRPESPLVELDRADTFEPIKKPDDVATVETTATSFLAQSNYWKKRLLQSAGIKTGQNIGMEIAAQEAFYMSDEELAARLNALGIPRKIKAFLERTDRKSHSLGGIYIKEDWSLEFLEKNDPRLYFLSWQESMLKSPVAPNVRPDIHEGKTVLITGGAGYVASGVIHELLAAGSNVVIMDNMLTRERMRVLQKIQAAYPGRITVIEGNITSQDMIEGIINNHRISGVVHLGAYIAAGVSGDLPATYYHNNVVSTLRLLRAMHNTGVKALSFASSAGVFDGKVFNKYGLLDEGIAANPTNPYGETKYLMEVLMTSFAEKHGINFTALRFFNLAGAFFWEEIGEWVGEGHLGPETHMIPRLIKRYLYGAERVSFEIQGGDYPTPDGTQIRDYIDVRDIARALLKSLSLSYDAVENEGPAVSEIINLGTGTPTSNKGVVAALNAELTARGLLEVSVNTGPRRGDGKEPPVLRAGNLRATQRLAWRAAQSLPQIVASALDFHIQEQKTGALNLAEPMPETMTGFSDAEYRMKVLDDISDDPTLTPLVKTEILLRLLVRSINPSMAGMKNSFKGDLTAFTDIYRRITEDEDGLFKAVSGKGFAAALTSHRAVINELIRLVNEASSQNNFGDDINTSRQMIALAIRGSLATADQAQTTYGGIDARDMDVSRKGRLNENVVSDAAVLKMITEAPGLKGIILNIQPAGSFLLKLVGKNSEPISQT
jgi:UDP-glucose 4-epimerase